MAECLLKKIQAIAVVNEEIIERIQGTSGSVSGFKYRIREACFDKGPMFFVEEVKQERSGMPAPKFHLTCCSKRYGH